MIKNVRITIFMSYFFDFDLSSAILSSVDRKIDRGHFKGFIFNKGFIGEIGVWKGEGETYTLD